MTDDRLTRALSANADAIELRPADPASVMRRGSARRNRRRAAVGGLAAVAVAATSFSVATREPSNDIESDAATATVVESPFDWTVVTPQSGLGYAGTSAVVDGTEFRLSTAPGPLVEDKLSVRALYRSDDGVEWTEVSMPSGMVPSSLSGAEGTLYALGTVPAGGEASALALSSSADGGSSWTEAMTLPSDITELEAQYPDEVYTSTPQVAAVDATHLVVTWSVYAQPDVAKLLPGQVDVEAGWDVTDVGVTLFDMVPCESGEECMETPATSTTMVDAAGSSSGSDGRDLTSVMRKERPGATYTWEQLSVDPQLQELIQGRTYVYASQDGSTFERVEVPGLVSAGPQLTAAAADGIRLYAYSADDSLQTSVFHSTDGLAWQETETLPGHIQGAGLLDGRPAVSLWQDTGGLIVQVQEPDGTWVPVDLLQGLEGPHSLGEVVFGPLGLVATAWDEEGPTPSLVHSLDGRSVAVVDLGALVDEDHRDQVIGLGMSADAITVRFAGPADDDPSTAPSQQVLVGTPR